MSTASSAESKEAKKKADVVGGFDENAQKKPRQPRKKKMEAQEGEGEGGATEKAKKPRKGKTAQDGEAGGGEGEEGGGVATAVKKAKKEPEAVVRDPIVPKVAAPGKAYCKIITWNVAGLRAVIKSNLALLHKLVDDHSPDILCLQETKLQDDHVKDVKTLLEERGYVAHWVCSTEKKGYSGCACFIRASFSDTAHLMSSASSSSSSSTQKQKSIAKFFQPSTSSSSSSLIDSPSKMASSASSPVTSAVAIQLDFPSAPHKGEGRAITVEFEKFILVNVYVPNSGQNLERLEYRVKEFDPYLREYLLGLQSAKQKPVILTGDLNCGHLDEDIHNPTAKHITKQAGLTPVERESFGKLLASGFTDAFRHFYPQARGQFTYWSQRAGNRPPNRGIRLDYFICSNSLASSSSSSSSTPSLFDCFHLPEDTVGCSDHAPAVLVLEL